MELTIEINGQEITVDMNPGLNLMNALRSMGYLGVKNGCAEGVCGSCTILVDNQPMKSCLLILGQINNKKLTTIEGIGDMENPHPVQDQFVEKAGIQCGFCIPGMVLSAVALLDVNPDPTIEEIKLGLEGNLCRCTGYVKQIEAVEEAAKIMRGDA